MKRSVIREEVEMVLMVEVMLVGIGSKLVVVLVWGDQPAL